jgi:hypothetical protein
MKNEFCCLGVLYNHVATNDEYYSMFGDQKQRDETMMEIIRLNDFDKKSFPEIADWIDKNL